MKFKLISLVMIFAFAMPLAVNAEEGTDNSGVGAEIRAQIEELKTYRQELKGQIESGELAREDAKDAWKAAIAELRAKKESLFTDKISKAKEKYEKLSENHPELGERIRARFEEMKETREARHQKQQELRESFRNGDIDQTAFRATLSENRESWREGYRERAERWKDWARDRNEGEGADESSPDS